MSLNSYEIQDIIERLQKGEKLPDDYKYKLFPTKQKEYELVYGGKMRKEDILANEDGVFPVPLQVDKIYNGDRVAFDDGWRNMIVFGDNLQFLKTVYEDKDPLIRGQVKGKVKLIYIDPPFGTGDEYDGAKGQSGYSAKTKGAEFVEFLRRRLHVACEILADDGCIFVRLDYHFSHYCKLVLDEIFGKGNFRNEIVVKRTRTLKGEHKKYATATDSVFLYCKNRELMDFKAYKKLKPEKEWKWVDMHLPGSRKDEDLLYRNFFGNVIKAPAGRRWTLSQEALNDAVERGLVKMDEKTGMPKFLTKWETFGSNWTDISGYSKNNNYPTENSEELLERVLVTATSCSSDIVLDFFGGSGTTAAVAEKLNRRWIVCDIGKLSYYTMQKRILDIENSKSLENKSKNYGEKARSFITVNTGKYDLEKLIKLEQNKYKEFVLKLFEAEPTKQKIKGFPIDGQRRDGGYCHIFPYWQYKETSVDETYIEGIHSVMGSQAGDSFYIIAPATKVAMFEDYLDIDNTRYYFLKVSYHVINELHKEKFKSFRQPQSKGGVNAVDNAVGFHFMRQPKVKSKLTVKGDEVIVKICEFSSEFVDDAAKAPLDRFQSFAMVIVDFAYDGENFAMDQAYFAEDLLSKKGKKKNKSDEGDAVDVLSEIITITELTLPSFKKAECGDKLALVYVDIYGNEFKETLAVI